jgi:hypothetical protein
MAMASLRSFVVPVLAAVAGLGIGALGSGVLAPEPRWAQSIVRRLDEHERLLERQGRAFDALASAHNDPHAIRPFGDNANGTCLTVDELHKALATGARGRAGDVAPDQPAAAASQAGADARDEAARLVDRAVSAGTWSEKDVAEFRSLVGLMMPAQRDQAMSSLFTALNQGRLKLGAHAPM